MSGRTSVPPPSLPPPIDQERRGRSPGIQNNFYSSPTADFKRPYGAPPAAEVPPADISSVGAGGQPFDVRRVEPIGGGGELPTPAGGGLRARMAPIVVALAGVAVALSEVRTREAAARKEAAEGRAREETLSRRLEALEAQLELAVDRLSTNQITDRGP